MSEAARRILIVEDQRLIAADLENTLKKLGYMVVGNVASGEAAIRTSDEVRPELVLMDVRLRGEMDGIHAAEVIRDRFNLPVVFLTAYADEETILRAKKTTPYPCSTTACKNEAGVGQPCRDDAGNIIPDQLEP